MSIFISLGIIALMIIVLWATRNEDHRLFTEENPPEKVLGPYPGHRCPICGERKTNRRV